MKWDGSKFHHATQSSVQFITYELFISGIYHLIFWDRGWPQVIETTENKMQVEVGEELLNIEHIARYLVSTGNKKMKFHVPAFKNSQSNRGDS